MNSRLILSSLFLIAFQVCFAEQVRTPSKFELPPDAETLAIQKLIGFGRNAQPAISALTKQPIKRGAHAKGSCAAVTVKVSDFSCKSYDAVRERLHQFNFFKKPASYEGKARVSNGSPLTLPDAAPDARGLTIQVNTDMGPMNYIMINHPVFFTNSGLDYFTFQALTLASAGKTEEAGKAQKARQEFLDNHPKMKDITTAIRNKVVSSYLETQYWTGISYKFGENNIVKYTALPCSGATAGKLPENPSATFLQDDFKTKVSAGEVCYELQIQFATANGESLEQVQNIVADSTTELLTPAYKIAEVQFNSVMSDADCEALKFNPVLNTPVGWEGVGPLAQIRGAVYQDSQDTRAVKPLK